MSGFSRSGSTSQSSSRSLEIHLLRLSHKSFSTVSVSVSVGYVYKCMNGIRQRHTIISMVWRCLFKRAENYDLTFGQLIAHLDT